MKKCFIIYNDQSGKKKRLATEKIYKILEKYNYETTIIYTKYKNHARDIVFELEEADLVISAGGDGTFNEVMTGNVRRKNRLLIANLPLGTVNDVGHMYGYTRNILKNLELLLNGKQEKIDICKINDHIFTYVAGFGNFMNIAYDTPRRLKKKYGKVGYLIYGLGAVRDTLKLFDASYKIGNKEYRGRFSFIFVTNSDHVAGVNDIYEDVKLNDGKFEVVFCSLTSKKQLLKSLCMLPLKHIDQIPGFQMYQTSKMEICFKDIKDFPWCIDGEKLEGEKECFTFNVIEDIPLLVPLKNTKELFIRK